MYGIKVVVSATDKVNPQTTKYNKTYVEGLFISKHKTCEVPKIKCQVERYLKPKFEQGNPNIDITLKISVTKLADDFVVCEDKE